MNALVDATPISGPALVIRTRSAARTRELFGTFTMPSDGPNPRVAASCRAPRVSAVSPDWGERHHQGGWIRQRVAVTELACLLHPAGHPGETFEPVPGHQPRMIGGPAGDDLYGADPIEHLRCGRTERRFQHPVFDGAAREGRRQGLRLLVDLLEHEVPPLPAVDHRRAQGVREDGSAYGPAGPVQDPDRVGRHVGDVPVFQHHVPAGDPDEGRDVGSNEVLPRTHPDDERASPDRSDETMRVVRRHHPEGVGPFQGQDRIPDRVEQAAAPGEAAMNPVPDHLRVGLGVEPVAGLEEIRADIRMVLDDPVVDDRNLLAAHQRVRIRLGRLPVRRPPGVGDPRAPVRSVPFDERFELRHLPHRADPVDAVPHHRETGRIVAAVFDPPQAFEQEGNHVTPRDRPDDSTHVPVSLRRRARARAQPPPPKRRFQRAMLVCRLRERVSCPGGASRVTVDPAPTTAASPTRTGATSSTPGTDERRRPRWSSGASRPRRSCR